MSLQRTCYLCGGPVSIRRRMSLFCSERCEARHRYVSRAPAPPAEQRPAPAREEGPLRIGRGAAPLPLRP